MTCRPFKSHFLLKVFSSILTFVLSERAETKGVGGGTRSERFWTGRTHVMGNCRIHLRLHPIVIGRLSYIGIRQKCDK